MQVNQMIEIVKGMKGIGGFEFEQQVAQICKQRSLSRVEAKRLTGRMYTRYVQPRIKEGVAGVLAAFARLCYAIDNAKKKAIGQEAPAQTMNAIIHCLATEIATRFEWSEMQLREVEFAIEQLKPLPDAVWLAPKFMLIVMTVNARLSFEAFALELSCRTAFKQQVAAVHKQLPDIKGMTQTLLGVMQELRKYGVKPCYFGADTDFRVGDADSWVIEDARESLVAFKTVNPVLHTHVSSAFGLISLARGSSITTFKVNHKLVQYGKAPQDKSVSMSRTERVIPVLTSFWFNEDGSLSLDAGNDPYMSLEPILRGLQLKGTYEVLQLQTVLHLFDLVVPTYRLRSPQLPTIPPLFELDESDKGELKPGKLQNLRPDLIIPRIRLLDHMSGVYSELNQEIEEADAETRARTRSLSNHQVIHHIRKLPPGRKASAEAHARAQEYGFVLKEGETFVRDHKRGDGDPIGPHRAVVRTVS